MKISFNYLIILSISLVLLSCGSQGQTIEVGSDEYDDFRGDLPHYVSLYRKKPFNGNLTDHYENGQLKFKVSYKNGKWDGLSEEYYENGQLMGKLSYKDGEIENGPSEEYYENGQLKKKVSFKDGKENGPSEEYYENGQLLHNWTYEDGVIVIDLDSIVIGLDSL